MPDPTYSAVLLAGGKSTRMGRDKALLPMPGSDLLFWQRQLHVLEELRPKEIFWSGVARPGMPENICIVSDPIENAGPLAGISAALDRMQTDLLVVLAIDLIHMTAPFLKGLLGKCSTTRGVVLRQGDFYEPLGAVYPIGIRGLVSAHLLRENFRMQDLVSEAVKQGLLDVIPLEERDAFLFKNVNSPDDL